MDWYAIWKDLDKGNATKRLINIPAWCIGGELWWHYHSGNVIGII